MSQLISVIIPCFNEAELLESTLVNIKRLSDEADFEILVVDGGSRDDSVNIAKKHARVVACPSQGRAWQLNVGAHEALGDFYFFLPAHANLPVGTFYAIKDHLINGEMDGGGFSNIYSKHNQKIKRLGRWMNLRFKDNDHAKNLTFYSDNGIFVRRQIFELLGGFKEIPIMEDYDFSRRLAKRYKSVRILNPKLIISPRLHEKDGFVITRLKWILIRRLYQLGVSPNLLAKFYH